MTKKKMRQKIARLIRRATGLTLGDSMAQARAWVRNGRLDSCGPGWYAPTYCSCCGPEHDAARLEGPKGRLALDDLRAGVAAIEQAARDRANKPRPRPLETLAALAPPRRRAPPPPLPTRERAMEDCAAPC